MGLKRWQLALIHAAVAITLVPINSTLNRVMIKELGISATLVAIMASLPYLFSPVQVAIGAYSDRHPIGGLRRTPYILAGLLLCVSGLAIAPMVVFILPENLLLGLLLTMLTFGAWGMGYNLAAVSYLSLATELSGEKGRTRTVAVMWFVMIIGIILTAAGLSRLLEFYSPEALQRAFNLVAAVALGLGLLGMVGLEPRLSTSPAKMGEGAHVSWGDQLRLIWRNPQARLFFVYLSALLIAILGQDILLEPYAAEAFMLSVAATTRITSIWGACFLLALVAAAVLEPRLGKRRVAWAGAVIALLGFGLILGAGMISAVNVFYVGVILLGLGSGLATVSNLSLMLDMTTQQVGLYMGAWGMASALARILGSVLGGAVRDVITVVSQNALLGYGVVFGLQTALLGVSLILLRRIDVQTFRETSQRLSLDARAAILQDVDAG
ncbi:PUCC protein [Thermanaerothrix daxensis]|uniref:PUCC protein n=1 Tax=Thermanaerothrix daxensis TaxID=869279 RepID=A0A0P6XND6_9CHLR|nr:BCD family MFS transporter [Thermanaerothrix daxensis]KPL84247.1 PUCC protein [Thermanaerothrix daxensis]